MGLIHVAGECPDGRTCPTLYETDRGTIAVQGYELAPEELAAINPPAGETVSEIPTSLLLKEVRRRFLLTPAELGEWIDARLTTSTFRLELLDHYDVDADGEDYARYMRGESGPSLERKAPWLDRLRRERQAGILNQRVHVLRTPLSDYLRYECEWGYAPNAAAGEDIRIIDLAESTAPAELGDLDFWLINNSEPVLMHYDDGGAYLGAEPLGAAHRDRYRIAREAALATAEPFSTWWARHPEEWRDTSAA